ncbi:MAG: hypothetical protein K2X11_07315 [Acetobacteraceae bacterium]|nr:hypothetical protein [Acetobacteraceae bacterium]
MALDLRRSLRRLKPDKHLGGLRRRPDAELDFAEDVPTAGPALLLDTCVYVDVLRKAAPPDVKRLLAERRVRHFSLVLGELSHPFGRLDPRHPGTKATLAALASVIEAIPARALEEPAAATMLEAGVLAGLLFRLRGLASGREVSALVDAALYLHALAQGYVVLTRNVGDFDLLAQLVPAGRLVFYRAG